MAQPNILVIMVDQLTALALSSYGHTVTKTPHLDRLATEGVVFENAYCNSPLCAPSRASMLTGRLPSQIGAYDNAASFSSDTPTVAHYLREMGYRTTLCGKMHFVGPDQLHGFEERLTTDIYPSDYGWTPDWKEFKKRPSWYHNMLSVVQAGVCQTSNQLDYDEEVAFQAVRKIYDIVRSDDQSPFFLLVSFTHPHDPFAITAPYWNRYQPEEIDLPAIAPLPLSQLDPHSQRLHHVCDFGAYRQTEERVRTARHAYYGMISYIDDKVGELMSALAATRLADDTVVFFLSDHGEMMGERGLWYKMSFFEHSARVPLIVWAPSRFSPHRPHQPVSLVDILPTCIAMADANATRIGPDLVGNSLLPWLDGENAQHQTVRGEILAEGAVAPVLMMRRQQYKYIYSPTDPELLFDLNDDPHELVNLAVLSDREPLLEAFRIELASSWDVEQLHQDVLASQRRRHQVHRALRSGKHTPWDFQPYTDASRQYMRNHLDLNDLERTSRFPPPSLPLRDGSDEGV